MSDDDDLLFSPFAFPSGDVFLTALYARIRRTKSM